VGSAIEVDHVSKRFRLYHEQPRSLKERVIRAGRNTYEEFWALRDVAFDVAQGETLGLLGHNGSGKSTLLKCVAGILRPTEGRIRKTGRTAALLELGSGFHPELTGRENLYLNGSILGLTRRDVARVFDDIVAFAELDQFIDNQVKHYSSGMYARLAFALAVNVEPEILLVDEVLAVGDEAFQRKCLGRIQEFQQEGRTILLVTHAADLVRQICDRAAVLDHGRMISYGDPGEAVADFRESLLKGGLAVPPEAVGAPDLHPDEPVTITNVQLELPDPTAAHLMTGERLVVHVWYRARERVDDVVFSLSIVDQNQAWVVGTNTDVLGLCIPFVEGEGRVLFDLESVPLLDGTFEVSVGAHSRLGDVVYHQRSGKDHFAVVSDSRNQGLVALRMHASLEAETS
jgi:ABC-2 type transport system ATP-binding protein